MNMNADDVRGGQEGGPGGEQNLERVEVMASPTNQTTGRDRYSNGLASDAQAAPPIVAEDADFNPLMKMLLSARSGYAEAV